LSQTEASTPPDPSQQQLQAAREEAELTLEQLHLVQEELEVYFLKAEELSETLQQRDAQINEKDTQLNQLRQELEQARGYISKSEELTQALQQREAQISEKDTQLNQLRQELEQARGYIPKSEELSQALQQRDALISEKDTQLNLLRQELEQARGYIPKSEELSQALQQRNALISEKDTQLNQLRQELEQANQNALDADTRTGELQKLLITAQKMLEGQATYLQDLSKKEEEAELAIERERQFTAEIVYLFENSRIAPGLDSSRIPRLRDLLQIKRRNTTRSR
jgi:chromosome segregation ATPase